ncbi:Uncharacterized protein SAPIO_CDS7847 [Scedosporium apiospermum]|uniref:Uncharacterized protein n=1 Tax=Pseudallescheria apiosperma TaxID=563466 RepID=A0A084G0T7_PSEDA|nr:Uncharacterized protein SAPIO_CDS7847 [Scedosporium apiospermum]KEZ40949.1 Uncharacterized protein SAPIO_CDS7847 [Scedosporium apiospermum]
MSAYYYGAHHAHPTAAASNSQNHHGRSRRAPRLSMSQNPNRQFRTVRSLKELSDSTALMNFRTRFEATRSFDLEDDLEFCPGLLTDSDLVSIHSASERSSLASNSPESSPTQQPQTVAPAFSLNSASPAFVPPAFHSQQSNLKLHQPAATRGRNAIPIVNPLTGATMSSPPPSVSPARMQQMSMRRW